MKQEDKELLLKDLCGRLPYGVIVQSTFYCCDGTVLKHENETLTSNLLNYKISRYKPYLLPMSSMTEEQKEELVRKRLGYYQVFEGVGRRFFFERGYEVYEWLNEHHFDYRGLIEKSLALDATNLNIYRR